MKAKNTTQLEDVLLSCLLVLGLIAEVTTFYQASLGRWIWCLGLAPLILATVSGRIILPKISWASFSPVLLTVFIGLGFWIFMARYYPERDNDALQFWLPKAKALAIYGYLPMVPSTDGRYTMNQDYPLGLLGLSAAVHSGLGYFSLWIHRLTLLFASFFIWTSMQRLFGQRRRAFELVLMAIVVCEPAIWVNGYHDAVWALCFSLGCAWILLRNEINRGILFLALAGTIKVESQFMLLGTVPIIVLLTRRPRILISCVPALFWILASRSIALIPSRNFFWPPHPLTTVFKAVGTSTLELLQFKTLHGVTSLSLVLAIILIARVPRRYLSLVAVALALYIAAYACSQFDVEWQVLFSWPRIILYPIFTILIFGSVEKNQI